jgi:cytoplasmic iron level regulating protein YaaA (DUF328/UPF0246 family)
VLILLPPSEGKAPGGAGPALDLKALAFPVLAPTRKVVLKALTKLAKGKAGTALDVLGLTDRQADELAADKVLSTAPTLPAADRYTGVLYEALDLPGLRLTDPDAFATADASVLIFSALWGVVRPADLIPAYRCSGGVTLPTIGPVARLWRDALGAALEPVAGHGLVVDLRSSAYAGLWRVPPRLADTTVSVRVLHERIVDGVAKRSVVSHFNKATKGRLARALLVNGATPTGPTAPTTPKEFAERCEELGYRVELSAPAKPGSAWTADVVVDSIG